MPTLPIPDGQPPPALLAGYKANFATLTRAVENGDVALMSAIRKADRMPVALVCAVQPVGDEIEFVPLAVLPDGDPYEMFTPDEH